LLFLLGVSHSVDFGMGLSDFFMRPSANEVVRGIDQHGPDQRIWRDPSDAAVSQDQCQVFARLRGQLTAYCWKL
jgi:hypothetical protein